MADPGPVLVVEEPVVGDLTEAKKVEEHAAQFEVAPVVTSPGVEVGTASIASEGECLKTPIVLVTGGAC